jgi:CHASE3 domain sensor protein
MKGNIVYFLLSALLFSTALTVVYTQVNKQRTNFDDLFV